VTEPDNDAFRILDLKLGHLSPDAELTKITELPPQTVSFSRLAIDFIPNQYDVQRHPPNYVQPHAPWEVYSSKVHLARELTKPGAEKGTYHFDLDVTDYPAETGDVDFVVGGAIGIQAPNPAHLVSEVLDILCLPDYMRGQPVLLHTSSGSWSLAAGPQFGVTTHHASSRLLAAHS